MNYENEIREIITLNLTSINFNNIDKTVILQEIGVNSLLFVRIIVDIEKKFNIILPAEILAMSQNCTISTLCEMLDKVINE